jgi:hypothetical protein
LEKRPDLGVEYSQIARFKLASRKSVYHVNEIISIDLAILNTSATPIFFRHLSEITINVSNKKGEVLSATPYLNIFKLDTPESFDPVGGSKMTISWYHLLVGCREWRAHQTQLSRQRADEKSVFEQGLFTSWGRACLDIEQPGEYTIVAEQKNGSVVVASDRKNIKTAVGTIRSAPLTFTIIE